MIVETRTGRIEGATGDGFHVFRGIPFACPPIGRLRLRAPRPVDPWTGVREATSFGASAPQASSMIGKLLGLPDAPADEDCLTLNVWTPGCDGARRPVLVWIHGGGFLFGAGSQPLYDGASLATRGDVVIVTANYRLGALGWLAAPGLEESGAIGGNYGLLDQLAALEWVRDNIAAFGGNPDNVTIFGESAGAMSVGALLGTDRARGLFHRAILQSGAAHNVSRPESAERVAHALLAALGLGLQDAAKLREVPLATLLDAQVRCMAKLFGRMPEGLPFQPVVDGTVLTKAPLAAIASGACAGVPLLLGTNLDEWKLFALADPNVRALDDAGLRERCAQVLPGEGDDGRAHADRVVDAYRAAREGSAPPDLWFAIEGDRVFRMPAVRLAEAAAAHGSSVQKYLFSYRSPAMGGLLGSCHALEVPFVFGTHAIPGLQAFVGEGAAIRALSSAMQEAWLAFARGESVSGGFGHWPAYESRRRATLRIDLESAIDDAPFDAERAVWDGLI